MNPLHRRREFLIACTSAPWLVACGGSDDPPNAYTQSNLVADSAAANSFKPALRGVAQQEEFIDAWGIAIRPAGAGGHFWVAAGGYSYQFLGDVRGSPDSSLRLLSQDALTIVRIPGAGVAEGEPDVTNTDAFVGFTTGVAFNGSALTGSAFPVAGQQVQADGNSYTLAGSARFVFCTDSGVISAWTERNTLDGSIVRRNGAAVAVVDNRDVGHAYFGIAIKPGSWDTLWAADFGADPQLRAWGAGWQPVALGTAFANPFLDGRLARPGDYVPFNVQVLEWRGAAHVFVAYAKSQPDPTDASTFFAGEEDALAAGSEGERPNRGKVVIYSLSGSVVQVVADDGRLNAPWGLAMAPAAFGRMSNALLVGNFGGAGRIAAYDLERGTFIDYLRRPDGSRVEIEGLWGLQFGNGASLGDSDALYFAAGPADETQGLFGALRAAG
jgi:uncharacterized protein (TIGR03118 family)